MTNVRPSRKAKLPAVASGWFPVVYSVTGEGHLAQICASVDVRQRWRAHIARAASGDFSTVEIVPPGTRARADLFDGIQVWEGPEFDLESAFPRFDRRVDGGWIVSDARCPVGELNARVINAAGTLVRRICLGDGILHLQCDQSGNIWVGYFDEGVYGNFGWGGEGPPPIGALGINRFDDGGRIIPLSGLGDGSGADISDCYAMNVALSGVWLCPYVDFPILRFSPDGGFRAWQNKDIHGASAIAVHDSYVVLVGGYQDDANRGAFLKLGEDQAEVQREFRFDLGGYDLKGLPLMTARNSTIHFVVDGYWYRIDVAEIAGMGL